MIKNIIIVALLVLVGFFIFSNRDIIVSKQEGLINEVAPSDTKVNTVQSTGKALNLSGQGLEKLPSYVVNTKSIEVLDISNNSLTGALPAEIRQLQNLRILDASNNEMTGVPAEIGQLKNLEVLNLSNNQLTGLPYELGNLKNLKTLDLSGNNYAEQDLEVIKEGLSEDVQIIL